MKTRILSGLLGGILFLFLILQGGPLLAIAVGFLSVLGTRELCRLLTKTGVEVKFHFLLFYNLLLTAGEAIVLAGKADLGPDRSLTGIYFLALLFTVFLLNIQKGITQTNLISTLAHLFVLFYPGFLFVYTLKIRNLDVLDGWKLLLFAFAVIWGTDTGAYFIGSAWGKNPLAPRLSPNKTIEGAGGGLLLGTLAGVLFGLVAGLPLVWSLGTGLLTSFAGQVGDLFESFLKRIAGVKDSGSFLPGHGGVLDRFDSALFALPVVYYLALLLIK